MKRITAFIILLAIISAGLVISNYRQHQSIKIDDMELILPNRTLKGLYLRPDHINGEVPGVVVIHGFSATKEMMRPFSEGLAEAGYAVVSIDMHGHGLSSGKLGGFGEDALVEDVSAAIDFIKVKPEVNASMIGLIGHSMGASAVFQTALDLGTIQATVVIGNSLTSVDQTMLNSSFPQNVMFAIGQYDELFSLDDTKNTFSHLIDESVNTDQLYGSFKSHNARKLVTAKTDHVFEVIAPHVVSESISWIIHSLPTPSAATYEIRPAKFILDQFVTFITALSVITIIPLYFASSKIENVEDEGNSVVPKTTRHILVHGAFSFFAFALGGTSIVLFANSYQFVFLGWYVFGSIFYGFFYFNSFKGQTKNFRQLFDKNTLSSTFLFITILLCIQVLLFVVTWDFRFVFPVLSMLNLRRIPLFLILWFFGTIFFTFEIEQLGFSGEISIKSIGLQAISRIWLYVIVLALYLMPIILFNTSILPPIVGFLSFFLIGFLPVLLIVSVITQIGSSCGYNSFAVAVPVSGLIAWILSANLPFLM